MNKQFDFTIQKFTEILECLKYNGYKFQSFEDFINNPSGKALILRHDVDRSPQLSLNTAKLENSLGIKGTYYFRIVRESYDLRVMKEIAALGHEIGYHYEDVRLAAGGRRQAAGGRQQAGGCRQQAAVRRFLINKAKHTEQELVEIAIESFKENLDQLRKIVPIKTICMHGSPMSRWDSRILWKYYDYRDYGIVGEPYFDLDFVKILYLTDTGRKWNGDKSSVRDKVFQSNFTLLKEQLKSSDNIMKAASTKILPDQIMITFHPQRWSDNLFIWMWEYGTQSVKNVIKKLIFVK